MDTERIIVVMIALLAIVNALGWYFEAKARGEDIRSLRRRISALTDLHKRK